MKYEENIFISQYQFCSNYIVITNPGTPFQFFYKEAKIVAGQKIGKDNL